MATKQNERAKKMTNCYNWAIFFMVDNRNIDSGVRRFLLTEWRYSNAAKNPAASIVGIPTDCDATDD